MPRSKHDVAPSTASKRPKHAGKAPVAPVVAAKTVLPVAKRHAKRLTERAQRLRDDPISGISNRRLRVMALQCGVDAMQSGAKNAIRAIVGATVREMLAQSLIIASASRRRSLRASHVTAGYERASTQTQQLYLAPDETATKDGGESMRRKTRKALKDGSRARKLVRVQRASMEEAAATGTESRRASEGDSEDDDESVNM